MLLLLLLKHCVSSPSACSQGRFCHCEQSSPCCRWPHRQCPSCLFRTVCRQHGVLVECPMSCQAPWHPAPALPALGGAEHMGEWGKGGFLMQDMTCAVQVCLTLTVPFTDEELFVSCQCCFPWGIFSLLFLPSLQLVFLVFLPASARLPPTKPWQTILS